MITVTGGLPGKNNVPVLLLLGIKIPGAPPPVGATVACLPWLEVTVPVKPRGPKIGVPARGKVEACESERGTVRGLAPNDFDDGDRPCREWTWPAGDVWPSTSISLVLLLASPEVSRFAGEIPPKFMCGAPQPKRATPARRTLIDEKGCKIMVYRPLSALHPSEVNPFLERSALIRINPRRPLVALTAGIAARAVPAP
jgi:hypothetical protein